MHLQKLINIVDNNHAKKPFPCIEDLVGNGLSVDRFTDADRRPQRHEITIFLASWCRKAGLEPEAYRDWLIDFSVEILSVLSASPASKIRHSTKSSIKYVHRSEVPFYCACKNNFFKAACSSDCPVYDEMGESVVQRLAEERKKVEKEEERQRLLQIQYEKELAALPPKKIRPKVKYKKQFEEAVKLIKQYLDEGYTKKAISAILNEKGYVTSIGSKWSPGSVVIISTQNGWSPQRGKRPKNAAVNKEQFEETVLFIKRHLDQGMTKKDISVLLNEKGYTTKTGCAWNPGSVVLVSKQRGWTSTRKITNKKTEVNRDDVPTQLSLFKTL
jgi:hypothetical protein